MVELNHRERTIKVKVVYYGPPVGGKTTNLQYLHDAADARRRGEMISINSAQDRTILFDLLPLKTPGFRGFDLRLQLLAVPGQAVYAATRRLVLKGADSLVFVANSALDRWEENVQSYREMTQNLLSHHLDPATMPLVFQYNKRDLPKVVEIEALDRALNARRALTIPAVAVRGEGVIETFTAILGRTVEDLGNRYAILNVKEGASIRDWAEHAVAEIFGARAARPAATPDQAAETAALPPSSADAVRPGAAGKLKHPKPPPPPPTRSSGDRAAAAATPKSPDPLVPPLAPPVAPAAAEPAAPGRTVVRAPPLDDAPRVAPAFPEGRAIELVESYAETSAQLGAAVTELREERDAAVERLQDLRQIMQAAQEILAGTPFDAALAPVLACMARIAGVAHATFWVPQVGAPPKAVASLGLASDPILALPGALAYVSETASQGPAPAFALAAENFDLDQALLRPEARFAAVLVVPFRTPGGLQGMGALYFTADAARPGAKALDHLAELPRVLAAALELVATLHTVKAAERALELALTGSASLRALDDVVRSIETLRNRLGEMRHRPDVPSWFAEEYVRLAPVVASALEDGRSLLGFSRGEIRREDVYLEDLLAELRTPEVTVELDPAVEVVTADATLLRVALRAVADEVRARVGSNTAPLVIRTGVWSDGIRLSIQGDGKAATGPSTLNAGLGLGLARRIAELHGGAIEDADPRAAGPVALILPLA